MEEFVFTPSKKSSFYATKYFNAGIKLMNRKHYFEALENFNKSLCHADASSELYQNILLKRKELYNSTDSLKLHEDPFKFFKLTYAATPTNPNIVKYLQVQNDSQFGRYVYTDTQLEPGDIIAIEEPLFKFIDPSARHLRCSHCLRSNKMNLIPSELCSSSELNLTRK